MSQVPKDLIELEKAVDRFDEWFRYAETIGQQRLSGFLFAASILLAGFATLYAEDVTLLSLFLSAFGIVFSIMWTFKGTRQVKFHIKIEDEAEKYFNQLKSHGVNTGTFPFQHVVDMKRNPEKQPSKTQLTRAEKVMATRNFLFLVPLFFLALYIVCFFSALVSYSEPVPRALEDPGLTHEKSQAERDERLRNRASPPALEGMPVTKP